MKLNLVSIMSLDLKKNPNDECNVLIESETTTYIDEIFD